MGRWYDDNVCKRCNERIHHDIYDDINSFIQKIKTLENKLDFISEIFPVIPPHNRNNDKFCPKEEANALIEKVRLLERKINNFSKVLPLENTANTDDGDQTSSNEAFENLIAKLKILEEKLGRFSKIKISVDPTKTGGSENDTDQIKEKLRAMEEKIEHFYELVPSNVVTTCVDETPDDPPIISFEQKMRKLTDNSRIHKKQKHPPVIMEQMRELADKINFYSKITSSTTTAKPSAKKIKTLLPKPIFSGKIVPKKKQSIKKGFITWPSDDDLSEISNDRRCYVMRCGESQANIKPSHLISEPSEFYFDSNLESQTNGISIGESKACGTSIVKNSELKR